MSLLSFILLILLVACLGILLFVRRQGEKALEREVLKGRRAIEEAGKSADFSSRLLLDQLSDGLLTVSPGGEILSANERARSLFGNRALLRRPIEESLLESGFVEPIREALRTKMGVERAVSFQKSSFPGRNGGHPNESHWQLEVVPVERGEEELYYVVVIRDVTESVRTDQIRKDFVANASHELRTPLAIIGGYLENLQEEDIYENAALARPMLATMARHMERINRLVEDMLVVAKLESGHSGNLQIAPFRIADCVQDVLERLEAMMEKQGAKISVKLANPELTMEGDLFYWTQILFNLVENALKQNSSVPVTVKIQVETEEGRMVLTVSDNGVGIPAADLPFIFKRFFRVEKHHSQNAVKGTGLGLSIVKNAVESHGGKLTAESVPGVRTTFSVSVPLRRQDLTA